MDSQGIGFMQGRLSPLRQGRIQSFPWDTWQHEFAIASGLAIWKMEWTIDSENFSSNPILTSSGHEEINRLKSLFKIEIPSVTCDYYMENPHWKSNSEQTFKNIKSILLGMTEIGAKILVIPLVDNSSFSSSVELSEVITFFEPLSNFLDEHKIKIAFETDLNPDSFSDFMSNFDEKNFGVNYDIGNSASLGFDPLDEFEAIGPRIINVHVKDRVLRGTTVPLGAGNADFPTVFRGLNKYKYVGNLIMQTARARDGKHAEILTKYRNQIASWIDEAR